MIPRRGLLAGLGALLAAPAIIRTEGLLMPVRPRLVLWGDGVHDDTESLQAIVDGLVDRVSLPGSGVRALADATGVSLSGGVFLVKRTLTFDGGGVRRLNVAGSTFYSTPTNGAVFEIRDANGAMLMGNHFETREGPGSNLAGFLDHWSKEAG